MAKMKIDSKIVDFEGTIESYLVSINKNPDSYLFLIDGKPVPMDTEPNDSQTVNAIRVASGG